MADQRKTFRPRRVVFGASFMLVVSLLPAFAEDAGLKNGAASLAAGKYDNAVRMLSSTINADNASPGEAAKALYLRGIAYRKLGQPSRAIADLGAAIFLGLPDQDRVSALVNRGLAYQAAGLSTQGDAEIAQARKAGGSSRVDQLIAEGGGAPQGVESIAAFSTSVTPDAQGYGANAEASGSAARRHRDADPNRQCFRTVDDDGQRRNGRKLQQRQSCEPLVRLIDQLDRPSSRPSRSACRPRARRRQGSATSGAVQAREPRRAADGALRPSPATRSWRTPRVRRRARDGVPKRKPAKPW